MIIEQGVGDGTVTLEEYQFTNFVPNEEEEFVLLTIKFLIDNGDDEEIFLILLCP